MAIKFRKERVRAMPQRTASVSSLARLRAMPPRRRLLIIYVGILVFSVLLFVARSSGNPAFTGSHRVHHGIGEVLQKIPPADPGAPPYQLRIRFSNTLGHPQEVLVTTEPEAWERFAPGDRLGVVYWQSWSGKRVRVVETGLFALPP